MKKLTLLFLLFPFLINAQDIIYTVTGDYNGGKTPLDSIIVDNFTNGTSMSFGDLPEHDFYQINLTKNAFWGTVSVFDLEEPSIFNVEKNSPGLLSVMYGGNEDSDARVSVININGQTLFSKDNLLLSPRQSLQVKLGSEDIYFVKIEVPEETKTFKAIGSAEQTGYIVEVSDALKTNSVLLPKVKSTSIIGNGNFTFEDEDSIRIWAYRKDIYAGPDHMRIKESDNITFSFEDVEYSTEMLVAYPDSVGEVISFTVNGDTLYCEEINGEYIHQGDIILTEEQVNIDFLKGAGTDELVKLWPGGIIYYTINFDEPLKRRVEDAILSWNNNTSLVFKERNKEENYIEFIIDNNSMKSDLGMTGSNQEIKVYTYASIGKIMHEIGHAIGLIHEHSRSDREESIKVDENKIIDEKYHNYERYTRSRNIGEFDWNSLMLYGSDCPPSWLKQSPKYTNPVMVKRDPLGETFENQESYLSRGDIKMVDELYGGNASKRPSVHADHEYDDFDNSMLLIGKIEDEGASIITEKGIAWKKSRDSDFVKIPVEGSLDNFNIKLAGLQPNYLYYYYAYAANSYGSAISEIISFIYGIKESQNEIYGKLTDTRDNVTKIYKTVKIGNQEWMAENLAYDIGDGSWAYNNDESNVATYGRLYTWDAAKKACPTSWHLPTDDEWKQMEMAIGMSQSEADDYGRRGTNEGTKLKATSGWDDNGNGTDDFGFSALPGGYRHNTGFFDIGVGSRWLSATEDNSIYAWYRYIDYYYNTVYRGTNVKAYGFSVRCIKD